MRVLFALAAAIIIACAAQARPVVIVEPVTMTEARWCTAHAAFTTVQWDCRYRTRAICNAAAPPERACLENPNWRFYRRVLR